MARLVKVVEGQSITCKVTTRFKDGTYSEKLLSVGDVVENLRYVEKEAVHTVTGRITAINTTCTAVTNVDLNDPKDYFSQDVIPSVIQIDASKQYESNLVNVTAREIVEDEGVENVVKVTTEVIPRITLKMTYTDGKTIDQDVEVGDVLTDMVIMTEPKKPDIEGDFRVSAFIYSVVSKKVVVSGFYLTELSTGTTIPALFSNIVSFVEKPVSVVTATDSLAEIATALSQSDEVFAFFEQDVTIPKRDDGRITSLFIDAGKALTVDLAGHNLNTQAYAFYVSGGTLNIRDTKGGSKITGCMPNVAYPIIQVNAGGVCNMEGGIVDTTEAELEEGQVNWLYGVVCSGDGVFNMTGGELITQDAAGISITNGTASGEGAQFNISGNAKITSKDCTAIYLADNKSVNVSGKAVINGGVLLRLGNFNLSGYATLNSAPVDAEIYPLGKLVCESGCENHNAAILAMTGCYRSDLGNDLNINILEFATINGNIDNIVDIATLNTKYNQKVNVSLKKSGLSYANKLWNIYNHTQLASMAVAEGKTLPAEIATTDLTIKVDGTKVYPA